MHLVRSAFGVLLLLVLCGAKPVQAGRVVAWGNRMMPAPNDSAGFKYVTAFGVRNGAIGNDGSIVLWGFSASHSDAPQNVTDAVMLALGNAHGVALRQDGSLISWGDSGAAALTIPAAASNIVQIVAGGEHTIALRADGHVIAWGANGSKQSTAPSFGGKRAKAISAFESSSMALLDDGAIYIWGAAGLSNGDPRIIQVGKDAIAIAGTDGRWVAVMADGTVEMRDEYSRELYVPTAATNVTAVSCGNWGLTTALRADGSVIEWTTVYIKPNPEPEPLPLNATMIASGQKHRVALRKDGSIAVWGVNDGESDVPSDLGNDVIDIAATTGRSIALTADGRVRAWGMDSEIHGNVPVNLKDAVSIMASAQYNFALKLDGTVVGWGKETDWSGRRFGVPHDLSNVVAIAATDHNATALLRDGQLVPLGDFWIIDQPQWPLTAIDGGGTHYVGLTGGRITAWGNLGFEIGVPQHLPEAKLAVAGYSHSVALLANGDVVGWGDPLKPVSPPAGLTNVLSLSAGYRFAVALVKGGTVIPWGDNSLGQLMVPTGLSNVVKITSGGNHTLALVENPVAEQIHASFERATSSLVLRWNEGILESAIEPIGPWQPVILTSQEIQLRVKAFAAVGQRRYFRLISALK